MIIRDVLTMKHTNAAIMRYIDKSLSKKNPAGFFFHAKNIKQA